VGGIVGGVSDAVGGGKGKGESKTKGKKGGGIASTFTDNIHVGIEMDSRLEDSNDNLSYDGDDVSTRDINATLGYGDLFAQFGADEIGTDKSGMTFLLGHGNPFKGLSLKTGAIRGEVGSGASYRWAKNSGVDAFMYDTDDPKYNAYVRVPVGRSYSVLAGMEDITGSSEVSVGIGATY
jgi:hypothetical protein